MGYLIRHIHNRDLATENIMTAYVRLRFILAKYPSTINKMISRFKAAGMSLPHGGTTLVVASEVRALLSSFLCISVDMSTIMFYVDSFIEKSTFRNISRETTMHTCAGHGHPPRSARTVYVRGSAEPPQLHGHGTLFLAAAASAPPRVEQRGAP
jgi:hypothetical protein